MTAHTISRALDDRRRRSAGALLVALLLWAGVVVAQGSTFTYQGQLTDAGAPANGDYDLQFMLFGADQGETQIGTTQTLSAVAVSNGLFTVELNFGVTAFPGENRFLEISVRPAGGGSFTTLTPRQFISATPYAIRSLNAGSADLLSSACTGCVQDSQIESVAGSKVSGTIPVASVPAGSSDYIQNRTTQQPNANFSISGDGFIAGNLTVGGTLNADSTGSFIQNRNTPQPNANFSISGSGTAGGTLAGNIVAAITQFNIGSNRVLSNAGQANLFAGVGAGQANTGSSNSFFGDSAGLFNAAGESNSFFGFRAGQGNTTGSANSYFGVQAGNQHATGVNNSFFGDGAGVLSTSGSENSYFGAGAGLSSSTGSQNTLIGFVANVAPGNLTNATAIGRRALVSQSNSLVLGSINGVNGASASTNVGIGTTTPLHLLQVGGGFDGHLGLDGSDGSPNAGYIRFGDSTGWKLHLGRARESGGGALNSGTTGAIMTLQDNGRVGIGTTTPGFTLSVNGTAAKTGGGSWSSISDERLKTIKGRFTPGVNAVMQLQPIRYEYTPGNALGVRATGEHIGFGAHAVRQVIPEAVTENDQGYLLVNNDPILWTMLNAIKEQQHEIEQLKRRSDNCENRLGQVGRRPRRRLNTMSQSSALP